MQPPVELTIDVTAAAGFGDGLQTAATVFLPEPDALADPPVVCFGFPGGGYNRHYYSLDVMGDKGGQAGWHTDRGWIFVACDHLGVGESTVPEVDRLSYENIAATNSATVAFIMEQLEAGTVASGYPAILDAVKIGIGQSMGGCFTILAQGQHAVFDGVGILGYSAIHTIVPSRPGSPLVAMPWMTRTADLSAAIVVNQAALDEASGSPMVNSPETMAEAGASGEHPWTWAFHYDDEPDDVVLADMAGMSGGPLPPWRSATVPACAILMVSPGTVAPEAAAIRVPVLVAVGERDVVSDPRAEPKAYKSAADITVFVCPRMSHMHNFASTRELFWSRIHAWGTGVAELTKTNRSTAG
jgi:pimeloyl-ACP methyl ester carboxylesterase